MVKIKTARKEGNRLTILTFEQTEIQGILQVYLLIIHTIFKEVTGIVHGDSTQGSFIYFSSVCGLGKGRSKLCFN